ncbi:alpha/beta fold hydrolase [Streptomyces sp. NPDC017936]|uniref:alpha/beta fold hydrolase n=1 Tax=Streptomyces sp. NPDC017936 TaxID=3365016 RepID=UPI003797B0E2
MTSCGPVRRRTGGAPGRVSFFEHQVRHYDSKYTEEISDKLGSLAVPVRTLWGERDRWQPLHYAERLSGDIPGADLVVVPDAGHFLMEDAPRRVAHEIGGFLVTPVPWEDAAGKAPLTPTPPARHGTSRRVTAGASGTTAAGGGPVSAAGVAVRVPAR